MRHLSESSNSCQQVPLILKELLVSDSVNSVVDFPGMKPNMVWANDADDKRCQSFTQDGC